MKLVYGFGINDADYVVKVNATIGYVGGKRVMKQTWLCPYYQVWVGMLARVYGEKHLKKSPTYYNCTVCEEWRYFSVFRCWMENQNWRDRQLDKDILYLRNNVYSPETCVFVGQAVNKFITEAGILRGEYPVGASLCKGNGKFSSQVRNPFSAKSEHLGYFNTPQEAHNAWLTRKLELAKLLAAEQDDPRVAKALVERYENYEEVVV